MVQKVIHFIKYHNAFTIILGVVFLSFGVSYAVSPEVREGVYSSTETVISVDNSAIVSADLDNFNFNLRVNSVTEDGTNYYVVYSYQTITVENNIWQNRGVTKTLKVSKEALGSEDLGLYLTRELGENVRAESSYLKRVQKLEREKGESRKVIAVEYGGLIGKLIDPKERVEEVNPVMPESVPESEINSNPIFVHENETLEPSPGPVISNSAVETSTSAATQTPVESLSPTASASELPTPTPESTPASSPEPSGSPAPTPTPQPSPEASASEATPTPEPTPEPTPPTSEVGAPTESVGAESTPEPTPE